MPVLNEISIQERQKEILDILQVQESVSVSDLAERLKVSEVTIRKDLTFLEKSGNSIVLTVGLSRLVLI